MAQVYREQKASLSLQMVVVGKVTAREIKSSRLQLLFCSAVWPSMQVSPQWTTVTTHVDFVSPTVAVTLMQLSPQNIELKKNSPCGEQREFTLSDGRLFLLNVTKKTAGSKACTFRHVGTCRRVPVGCQDGLLARAIELTGVHGARLEVQTCSVSQTRSEALKAEVQRQTANTANIRTALRGRWGRCFE